MSDFKIIKLLCTGDSRSATVDGVSELYFADSIKLYLKDLPDLDIASARVDLYTVTAPAGHIAETLPSGFSGVVDKPYDFYCTLDLNTPETEDLMDPLAPGDPVPTRLIVSDTNGVWADVEFNLYANPAASSSGQPPIVGDPFVTESALATALTPYLLTTDSIDKSSLNIDLTAVQSLPTLSPADREVRFNALLTVLLSATA